MTGFENTSQIMTYSTSIPVKYVNSISVNAKQKQLGVFKIVETISLQRFELFPSVLLLCQCKHVLGQPP